MTEVTFQGVEVPGRVVFDAAENLREDIQPIGRPEIDAWDTTFTPKEPKPRKVPMEVEIIYSPFNLLGLNFIYAMSFPSTR